MKSTHRGLIYLKYFFNGAGTREFAFEDQIFRNIVDIFELRRRLYNIQDIETANFKSLLGIYVKEHNFGEGDDLRFHSNFDSGNLFTAIRGQDGIYYIEMAADSNTIAHPHWFHFAVTNMKQGEKAVFRVMNFSQAKYVPSVCFRSRLDGGDWERMSVKDTSFYRNDLHGVHFDQAVLTRCKGKLTLEFVFEFPKSGDTVYFASSPPYSYEDLQRDSLAWQLKCHEKREYCFRKKLLCYTLTGRKLFYFEAYRAKEKVKTAQLKEMQVVILTARTYPNEPASSHMLKGFVDRLLDFEAGHRNEAGLLRQNFLFIIIPMLNPDGVSAGNSTSTFAGVSLGKSFSQPDRFITPESYYTRKLIQTLAQTNKIVFYADFRSSDRHPDCWLRGCEDSATTDNQQRELSVFLADWLTHFDLDRCK